MRDLLLLRKIITLLLFTLILATSFAQNSDGFKYQAIIRDATGNVNANTGVQMDISILQGTAEGTAVFAETHNVTSNTFGLVNLTIGSQNPTSFELIDWANGPYFIKIIVDGMEFGTSQLLSVPYALHAKTAESVNETDPLFVTSSAATITPTQIEDWTNKLSEFAETDPSFNASVAAGITATQIESWTNKLDTFVETDPEFAASLAKGINATDTAYWNSKLDDFIESDPTFIAHPASGITEEDIIKWKALFIWYTTNSGGFLTSEVDGSVSNEIQVLSISNDTVYLEKGGFAKLPQETQTLADVIAVNDSANATIKNLTDPTDPEDASTKKYVDNLISQLKNQHDDLKDILLSSNDANLTNDFFEAFSAGGTGNDNGNAITSDAHGNIYITGYFQGTADFGTETISTAGEDDIFIAKYDSDGNIVWAKSAGGPKWDKSNGITCDDNGNIFITGSFGGTATFDTHSITAVNAYDEFFIAKYDLDGNALWVKSAGGTSRDIGNDVTCDEFGNVYVTGYIQSDTVIFGIDTISATYNAAFGFNMPDAFIAKYDTDGNPLWARVGNSSKEVYGLSITYDGQGNIYMAGNSWDELTFDTASVNNTGHYLVKYNLDGELQWLKGAGGNFSLSYGMGIITDATGNIYLTKCYSNTITFAGTTLNTAGNFDALIVKYDKDGNEIWAISEGGTYSDIPADIACDALGNIYMFGHFSDETVFDGVTITANTVSTDVFIAKYDSNGNFSWIKTGGGSVIEIGSGLNMDPFGNLLMTGFYSGTAVFGNDSFTSKGIYDVFVWKFKN